MTVFTPTWQLQEALTDRRWQGGETMSEREVLLVEQLIHARTELESTVAQLEGVAGQLAQDPKSP